MVRTDTPARDSRGLAMFINEEYSQTENVACFYAMKGDPDRSLELLERAVENGWGDLAWLETDSDLDTLRDDDRFRAILAGID